MEPNTLPTPPARERNRRSDRYRNAAQQPAAPSYTANDPPVPTPQYPPYGQPYRPAPPEGPPPTMARRGAYRDHMLQSPPVQAAPPRRAEEKSFPAWLTVSLVAALLICLGFFAGQALMDAYLVQRVNAREKARVAVLEAHPMQYRDLIERYCAQYNLQPAFVSAIILNESSYNTLAESRVGARGLMQLMPDTAQWIAHKLGLDETYHVDQLYEAETNIRFGCWYLSYLSRQFAGDPVTVAGAYHAGQGEITGWLGDGGRAGALTLDAMPDGPTKVYAGRVTRDYAIYDALYFGAFNALSMAE